MGRVHLFALWMTLVSVDVSSQTTLKPEIGKRLVTSSMASLKLPSLARCLDNCMYNTSCLSINYVRETELCELLRDNMTSVLTSDNVTMETNQPGYLHADITDWLHMRAANPCSGRPCDVDMTCVPCGNTAICGPPVPVLPVVPASNNQLGGFSVEKIPFFESSIAPVVNSSAMDVVMIVQAESSIGEENFQKVRDFLWATINGSDVDSGLVRFGLMTYDDGSTVNWNLNSYSSASELRTAVSGISLGGSGSSLVDAIKDMNTGMLRSGKGDRSEAPNVCIVVTVGESSMKPDQTGTEAERLKNDGLRIFALGIGITDPSEMDSMVSDPLSDHAFYIQNYDELADL